MLRLVQISAGLAVSFFFTFASPHAETLLERGQYLMNGIVACGNCHTPQGPNGPVPGQELAGGSVFDEPVFKAYAPNITPDEETGIGSWSDDEILHSIREGKRPDGSIIGPPMPIGLYRGLSDRDGRSIVAYLRSIPAVRNEVPKSEYGIPLPPSYGPPVGEVPDVSRADKVAYGAYLSGPAGHCIECHTPLVRGRADFANRLGVGGNEFHGPWGTTVSRNITPHQKDGIGGWSDDEIKRAITQAVRPDGSPLLPPMGYGFYRNISDSDLDAIVAFLRAMRPLANTP